MQRTRPDAPCYFSCTFSIGDTGQRFLNGSRQPADSELTTADVLSKPVNPPRGGAVRWREGGEGSTRLAGGWSFGNEFEIGCLTEAGNVGRDDMEQAPALFGILADDLVIIVFGLFRNPLEVDVHKLTFIPLSLGHRVSSAVCRLSGLGLACNARWLPAAVLVVLPC